MRPDLTGMDISQIRRLANSLDREAGEIDRVLTSLGREVENVPWVGHDRDRFVGDWRDHHGARLRRVVDGLRDGARHARAHADAQERASRAH